MFQNVSKYRVSPEIRQGLYHFSVRSMTLEIIFGGCLILMYQKMKLESENYEIFK